MPKFQRIFRVFIASPSDVLRERNTLENVVRELDLSFSPRLNIRLELVRWETHVYPAVGEDPQAVVNKQVGDYDIFIGVLWARLGSPTPRAESGTLEEFQIALDRADRQKKKIEIMLFFKDAPVHPRTTDLEQLRKVREFRSEVEKRAIVGSFRSIKEFETHVRISLTRILTNWPEVDVPQGIELETQLNERGNAKEYDEYDFQDLLQAFGENLSMATQVVDRFPECVKELGDAVSKHSDEYSRLHRIPENLTWKHERLSSDRLGRKLRFVAGKIRGDVSVLREAFYRGLDALQRSTQVMPFPHSATEAASIKSKVKDLIGTLDDTVVTIIGAGNSTKYLSSALDQIPERVASLKSSKATITAALSEWENELLAEARLAAEAGRMYKELLRKFLDEFL